MDTVCGEAGRRVGTARRSRSPSAGQAHSSDFTDDWVLTHEMVHLAFPSVPEEHHWIEEGSATYIEPIARARAGDLTPEKVWGDLVDGLPQGLPQPGDRGLDFTPTWGRTYWGGALFCLLADIEIRKRTANQEGSGRRVARYSQSWRRRLNRIGHSRERSRSAIARRACRSCASFTTK